MMPTIRIEDDVFLALKSLAEAFVDTPNTVIRRLLSERNALPTGEVAKPKINDATTRINAAPVRSRTQHEKGLTPQPTYEDFLLHVLATKFNGKAHKHEATKGVLELMTARGLIGPDELKTVSTGETRAANTVAWGRNALKERGLISHISPRGFWELTPKGKEKAQTLNLPTGNKQA